MLLSVIIPTYNPNPERLSRVLEALRDQSLGPQHWQLVIVDNNSSNGVLGHMDLSWHPNHQIVAEKKQGLTFGRIAGFRRALGDVLVLVDDDNVLARDYLSLVTTYFSRDPALGSAGGRITASFDGYQPQEWTRPFWNMLAIRDPGNRDLAASSLSGGYPAFAPVGAGMAVRKALVDGYIREVSDAPGAITDRTGNSLASGGDNEINIWVLKQGYKTAYFPKLSIRHIIPASRLEKGYLARLNYESTRSWAELLRRYDLCPWDTVPGWSVGLRKIKSWFVFAAWRSPSGYVKWRGACGLYEGLIKKPD
ncbi:glycosyltransferase [Mucilaginibacter ginsenosidivorans]|uniref:Glycosyltransferase family 2 protein n=1 Tax=Mucilaginibacter ginsenosidivorans TaxID=398053 RepID=A0A5B8UVV3_9SPHI|nr:glycosyltransferase [Mucilaginibacter ginsenosidivorans]QEC62566.1 glycosyltransferase family 2 protein [Mucilaginibacter ginsenosidivorans]